MVDFNFGKLQETEIPVALGVNFYFGQGINYVLAGNSNFFTAVWADSDTGRNNGKLYVTSYGSGAAFSILDLNNKVLYDRYTLSTKGRSNESLEHEDIIDLNIGE